MDQETCSGQMSPISWHPLTSLDRRVPLHIQCDHLLTLRSVASLSHMERTPHAYYYKLTMLSGTINSADGKLSESKGRPPSCRRKPVMKALFTLLRSSKSPKKKCSCIHKKKMRSKQHRVHRSTLYQLTNKYLGLRSDVETCNYTSATAQEKVLGIKPATKGRLFVPWYRALNFQGPGPNIQINKQAGQICLAGWMGLVDREFVTELPMMGGDRGSNPSWMYLGT
uniref:Uncharacterized protein n=1 Tax=Timema genevievae TaxID=629358 RepID=A0A7R9KA36_TIMGE|nr:unnamed protein product [Timema genevievae]